MTDKKIQESITDLVLRMAKEDRIVYTDLEGFTSVDLDKWLDSQPIDGILYDLNRLGEVALTFMEDDIKWVNDFAVGLVITRLKERCDAQDTIIAEGREIVGWISGHIALIAKTKDDADVIRNMANEWLKASEEANDGDM